jgi:NADPH:quinone reductase-like Zn-dependent oxidoreductase
MRAVALRSFGGPEALAVEEWSEPSAPDGWAVVELRAAALNWHDVLLRQGVYDVRLPHIIGADGAGRRRDTGEEVIVLPSLWWGADDRFPAREFEIIGDRHPGTYAELIALPVENLFAKPEGFSSSEAAALPLAGLTAFRALFTRGGLRHGETVLVLGAGGGVATTAIGLATLAGARVLVTSSSAEKLERAVSLGASGGALYTDDRWAEQIRQLVGRAGVDLVFDSAGGSWPEALGLLRGGGRLVNFGATAAEDARIPLRKFYFGQYSILGTTMGSPRDFAGLLRLLSANPAWRPVVDSVIPLEEAPLAHARMERREHFGKLVLSIG